MDATVREIQPVVSEPWSKYEQKLQEKDLIQPLPKGDLDPKLKAEQERKRGQSSEGTTLDPRKAKEIAQEIKPYLDDLNIQLNFTTSEETGELIVQMKNRETGDVIRQIPPENMIKLRESLKELRGVFLDGKA